MRTTLNYIGQALRQHSNVHNGMVYAPSWQRWLYTFKAVLCIILNRYRLYPYDYHVLIAYTDGGKSWSEYGTSYWSEWLYVGWGWRTGWWYSITSDSSH
jgi:hypothetical protein